VSGRASASTPVTAAFGRRARELRLERGWTLREAAVLADVAPSTLYRVEAGEDTTLAVAGRVADAFGVPIAVMFDPDGCPNCHGAPKRGFTCQECGEGGPALAGVESAGLRFAEPSLPPVPGGCS